MSIVDATHLADAKRYPRAWDKITAIVLHQTGCVMGERYARFIHGAPHYFVTRRGVVIQIHPLDVMTGHANGLNPGGVGIEIDGMFCGVEGDASTFWRPKGSKAIPMHPTPQQVDAALELCRWIVRDVRQHGGKVKHILAHRQSSGTRRSDPGSEIWQMVAMPIMLELGLDDGGDGFKTGSGRAIPREWDARRNAKY